MLSKAPTGARMPSANCPDVAVIGGGLCGRLLSWRLALSGLRVALYERGDAQAREAAAWVAAAMLAPLSESAVSEPLLAALGAASLERWATWVPALPAPVFFQRNGTLVVWHNADQAEAHRFHRMVTANAPPALLRDGLRALDRDGVAAVEPALKGRFRQGWLLPNEGQLDNRQLLAALGDALTALNVPIHAGTAIDATNWPSARLTVDCRGLGSREDIKGLRGVRGEVVRVDAPAVRLSRPVRLLHPRYPIYIAPKEAGRFVIGATELESEDMSPMSVRSALELLSAAYSVDPGFGEARIAELNVQCRPTLPDHRPAIVVAGMTRPASVKAALPQRQASAPWRAVERASVSPPSAGPGSAHRGGFHFAINGLYRHGFMIAPEVVALAADLAHAMLSGALGSADGFQSDGEAFAAWRAGTAWPDIIQPAGRRALKSESDPAAAAAIIP